MFTDQELEVGLKVTETYPGATSMALWRTAIFPDGSREDVLCLAEAIYRHRTGHTMNPTVEIDTHALDREPVLADLGKLRRKWATKGTGIMTGAGIRAFSTAFRAEISHRKTKALLKARIRKPFEVAAKALQSVLTAIR